MPNATAFWGALDGNNGIGNDCRGETSTLLTCNGNGNGLIEGYLTPPNFTHENFLFWSHLANSGLIEGKFTGNFGQFPGNVICTGTDYVPSCNVPQSKFGQSFWFAISSGNVSGNADRFDGNYGNILAISNRVAFTGGQFQGDLLRPEDAWNIDSKLDDGLPGLGNIVASRWSICTTATAASQTASAQYRLNSSAQRCMLIMRNAF